MCALYGGLHVRRGRKLSPCAGGERGAFGAGGRALCAEKRFVALVLLYVVLAENRPQLGIRALRVNYSL